MCASASRCVWACVATRTECGERELRSRAIISSIYTGSPHKAITRPIREPKLCFVVCEFWYMLPFVVPSPSCAIHVYLRRNNRFIEFRSILNICYKWYFNFLRLLLKRRHSQNIFDATLFLFTENKYSTRILTLHIQYSLHIFKFRTLIYTVTWHEEQDR